MPTSPSAVNYWPDNACARAFWGQQELPPYRQLLADTEAWLDPKPGERWLDLGCGCGMLTRAIWVKSGGRVAEVVGLDCAAANEAAFDELRAAVRPPDTEGRIRFAVGNFSTGLAEWPDRWFDGIVSGLAIQYAESYSGQHEAWTTEAYDRALREVCRLLRPSGRFVFSVNVPNPSWARVVFGSVGGFFHSARPWSYVLRGWQMWRYGNWLKREAGRGRFHYLPLDTVLEKLHAAGFGSIEHRLSFSTQAYLIRCRKAAHGLLAA